MTEVAIREPQPLALVPDYRPAAVTERDVVDGWIAVMQDVAKLAGYVAETDFVPKALRNKPAAIAACILTGRELGIGPMQSLKSIHMVQGVPSLSAEYKRARALAAGHEIAVDESTATRCIIRGCRAGSSRWVTVTWTMDMARRAKLDAKDVWKQYPQRMLQARASSELCDLLFPDAALGLETTEIIEDGGALVAAELVDTATGELTAGTAPAIAASPPRTAQRKPRAQSSPPAPAAPPVAVPAPSGAGGDLPPLPGEDEPAAPAPDEANYDTHGTATRGKGGQLTALWTILSTEFEFTDAEKAQARTVCEHIINRELAGGTTGDMSRNEAKTVLDTLGHWQYAAEKEGQSPREYMTALMVAQDSGPADA